MGHSHGPQTETCLRDDTMQRLTVVQRIVVTLFITLWAAVLVFSTP